MIPTFLALASPLLFNQLGLWRIHQCVPFFQPRASSVSTSWHNRLSGARKDPSRPSSSQLSRSSLPHSHPAQPAGLPTPSLKRIQNT